LHRLGLLLEGGCLLRDRLGSHRLGRRRLGRRRLGWWRLGRRLLLNLALSIVQQLLSFGRLAREEEHA
jgi:hypothetical protein